MMAEAAAAVGLVAAVAQFIEYGVRLMERLDDLSSSSLDRPNALTAVRVRLPAVVVILRRIQKQAALEFFSAADTDALLPLIRNTSAQVQALLARVEKSIVTADAVLTRYVKAMRSLANDRDVQRISARIQDNLLVISTFLTTSLVDVTNNQPPDPRGVSYRDTVVVTAVERAEDIREDTDSDDDEDDYFYDTPVTPHTPASEASWADLSFDEPPPAFSYLDGETLPEVVDSSTDSSEQHHPPLPAASTAVVAANKACSASCSCICHRPYQYSTPSMLTQVFGHLSLNYAGQVLAKVPCTERRCQRRHRSAARLTYRFPSWVLNRALHLAVSSTALNTKINLNTLRVLPDSAEVLAVIARGDLDRLRAMFAAGQASIYDVTRTNWTLVHTAFTLGRTPLSQFLIDEGADLDIDAANGSNVVERAWFLAQSTTKVPGDYVMQDNEVLREVDLDDFVRRQQYNLIHKIVLGVSKLDLATALDASTALIDGQDIQRATPLYWDAAQGNVAAASTLLAYGASQTVGAGMDQLPLHVARNADMVRLLHTHAVTQAQTRANHPTPTLPVHTRDSAGRTPLHCYCYRHVGASVAIVREILACGAAVDARASGAQTPLHYAVMFGNLQLVAPLVEHGADVNAVMRGGMTPLLAAVRYDQGRIAAELIGYGADPTHVNSEGKTIAHLAALYGGVECLSALADMLPETLAAGEGCEIPVTATAMMRKKDSLGKTPEEYYETRGYRFAALDEAFHTFAARMHTQSEDNIADRTDDVFEAASEVPAEMV